MDSVRTPLNLPELDEFGTRPRKPEFQTWISAVTVLRRQNFLLEIRAASDYTDGPVQTQYADSERMNQ